MKKQLFNALLFCMLAMPAMSIRADVVAEGQSTEGKDFWVTFMQADQGNSNNGFKLSVSISSRKDCKVYISNPYSGYKDSVDVTANEQRLIELYSGSSNITTARNAMASSKKVCYAGYSEQVDTCALHFTSTEDISLFATNYKIATFDATNVLPTTSLKDEYYIQTYSPSDHDDNEDATQGSHFAIIAAEDNTIVDYVPTVPTKTINDSIKAAQNKKEFMGEEHLTDRDKFWLNYKIGDTLQTPVMKSGQVYYVWTGSGKATDWKAGDLSGTYVKARNGKKIAVFQGCPHTNIPYHQKERDHIFSQAMPVQYWGNTFVLTQSVGRKRDVFRIMALNDETEVRINGNLVHTFDFTNGDEDDKKHFFEFEMGDATIPGSRGGKGEVHRENGPVCYVTTSCPCSVHEFLTSRGYDQGTKEGHNGDPAMLWVNPIEQQIDQITFATYASDNSGKSAYASHYVNIITENKDGMYLGTTNIASEFTAVPNSKYYYARHTLDQTSTNPSAADHAGHSYTLKNTQGSFIAHVYGFTANESYGYSAGGATVPLSQSIYINGEEFSPDKENNLCGKDTVKFECKPDFMPDSVIWHFGDGTPDVKLVQDTTTVVKHYYSGTQDYYATCSIYRNSSNVCVGQSAVSVIKIKVSVGRYTFSIGNADIPCPVNGVQGPGKIPYTSTIDLTGKNVTVDFDDAAKNAGFTQSNIAIRPTYFELILDGTNAEAGVPYGIKIDIKSDCGDTTAILPFRLPVGNDVIAQRYTNVLGLLEHHPKLDSLALSDFQWYRVFGNDTTLLEGQIASNLNMYDLPKDSYKGAEFFVCYYINKGMADQEYTCACAKGFGEEAAEHNFATNPDSLFITANYEWTEDKVFVNANYKGEKDIECYAQWITSSGNIYGDLKFTIPDGGCTIPTPNENGLYLLRVVTDGKSRSFKFVINKKI